MLDVERPGEATAGDAFWFVNRITLRVAVFLGATRGAAVGNEGKSSSGFFGLDGVGAPFLDPEGWGLDGG